MISQSPVDFSSTSYYPLPSGSSVPRDLASLGEQPSGLGVEEPRGLGISSSLVDAAPTNFSQWEASALSGRDSPLSNLIPATSVTYPDNLARMVVDGLPQGAVSDM